MFDFASKKGWFLLAALVVTVVGLVLAFTPGGLTLSWDFQGGFQVMLQPNDGTDMGTVSDKLSELGFGDVAHGIQETGGNYLIRLGDLGADDQEALKAGLGTIGTVLEGETGFISPAIASRTTRDAAIAVSVAMVLQLAYVTFAFRKVPHSFRYGTAAVVALLFNIVVTMGIFSIFGRILGWEVDPLFITAMLAIIGYSINDSIVVLDRIRENKSRGVGGGDYNAMVNFSISETLVRSLNTSITTVLAILTVYLIVGGPIRSFLMALFVGVVAGTYSSIFVAGQLLVMWERGWFESIPGLSRLQKNKA